ncbi:hypothetical protein RHMOL_Rhmol06G0192700 [Rhododendron molle]|uniref:Uncharacterized protein n=1 Tax=Rhododendron molle TaxID=49168 RepID=A0ACC0NE79_RHOML|nr:hypothetical protein RHMOL_Rhmol06G0192700 [Rhododendron molle]
MKKVSELSVLCVLCDVDIGPSSSPATAASTSSAAATVLFCLFTWRSYMNVSPSCLMILEKMLRNWLYQAFKLVRDNLTGEKNMLEQAEETPKALDLNKVCMIQPKAKMYLQFESSKLSTSWSYLSAIALMSGFFLKPDARLMSMCMMACLSSAASFPFLEFLRLFVKEKARNGKKANREALLEFLSSRQGNHRRSLY